MRKIFHYFIFLYLELIIFFGERPRHVEVIDFDLAFLIDQNIWWLDISMYYVGRMNVFKSCKAVEKYYYQVVIIKLRFRTQVDQVFQARSEIFWN